MNRRRRVSRLSLGWLLASRIGPGRTLALPDGFGERRCCLLLHALLGFASPDWVVCQFEIWGP